MTLQELQDFINYVKDNVESNGRSLADVEVHYRHDYDSDVEIIEEVAEDLFDADTNNIIESIILVTDKTED